MINQRQSRRDQRTVSLDQSLVRAALWRGPVAMTAWMSRPSDFDLDEIWNPRRHRLLGQIGLNLAAADSDDPELPRLTEIARKQWVEHHLVARRRGPPGAIRRWTSARARRAWGRGRSRTEPPGT